ncbi:16S rRNA (guanine(966)-N(2))-methyltransferase RsmD [Dellaglioa carnosa]|uniref:16S rRNA (Guanine(966)-N(2))-methyltransferase RsmD n=1 Tax=Dellaglioa carnosa TaxID=2995136 RepID=A0ABT4JLE3_9LACO|nr:16S rRNA (guanine(966)-N(2))-methyltransferase RsmD [Dellaglioa carnosa]MCZ2490791.1 16S rRNA (guanine(966)-N(2))-methyltransferase RsmD [Dellaglioa carnosa]MCZ2493869.1 16S rRNA (guanine(966)-N(2))-methyltransferase RsmD [Dellaglioa carnosa]MDK1730733.1 16S rRNA (guanine(966)-N(2))-methyltransferase RsmD [Dellaglioa carnosa]
MRIISGEYGGRKLKAVPGMATRPTTDKVKESMFNIIGPYFDGGKSLDLFAGSGGLSIEAVSRGIGHATLIDRQYQAIKTINDNIAITKEIDKFTVYKQDADKAIGLLKGQESFDLVFLDPPYKTQEIIDTIQKLDSSALLNSQALIICETDQHAKLPDDIPGFSLFRRQNYGITQVTIYQKEN